MWPMKIKIWMTKKTVFVAFTSLILMYIFIRTLCNYTVKIDKPSRPKLILAWEANQVNEPWGFGMGTQSFRDFGCPQTNCELTIERRRFHEADAVLFNMRHIFVSSKYLFKFEFSLVKGFNMPFEKPDHHRWIYLMQEPPIYTNPPLHLFNNLFNWTMTYKKDSDIYVPHGIYRLKPPRERIATRENFNYAKNKTKLIAWFVSHCHPHSQREKYVEKLRRYIDVDIYGACGSLKCPRKTYYGSDGCYEILSRDYKFYLAFENSICRDYASAKFWTILQKTTAVPIVRGGLEYEADGPPNSFVDANNLTPKELAAKLKNIGKNDQVYNSYHTWRKDYQVFGEWRWNNGQGYCQICAALNNASLPKKFYPDLEKFWSKTNDCLLDINPQLN